jgi:4-amino-4-deoxy-L-arabinose transferase-like glycosyltransferase
MATQVGARKPAARARSAVRVATPRWSAPAWGAIGVTALFLAITCWWLTQDRSIPIFDAGLHLSLAIEVHRQLSSGHLVKALTLTIPYPPFAYLIGSLGIALGGVGIAPLILAENLVFVPLLALGCYHVGRLAFGPAAGLLAVVFALGSPLITAQFHVFMIDAPETAMVAVSVWLVIATEGFSRLRVCALAGLAVGLGMLTKEPFAIFLVGIVGVTAIRGGRESWRGLVVFAAVALAIALPWYIHEHSQIQALGHEATDSAGAFSERGLNQPQGIAPPRLSLANLEWYLWSFLNAQLFLPLFVFAAVGWAWTVAGVARRRPVSPLTLELVVGAFLSWALLTETFVHDTRYSMPLLVYLAVFGAGWIVRLPRRGRIAATAALVLVALANTLGASFGVGGRVAVTFPGASKTALERPGTVIVFDNSGYLVAGPRRDGDLLAMLQALHRAGVRDLTWPADAVLGPDFSQGGLVALATIAGLGQVPEKAHNDELTREDAVLSHDRASGNGPPPCVRLDDGTGIWVRIGNPLAPGARDYCPLPKPHFYG